MQFERADSPLARFLAGQPPLQRGGPPPKSRPTYLEACSDSSSSTTASGDLSKDDQTALLHAFKDHFRAATRPIKKSTFVHNLHNDHRTREYISLSQSYRTSHYKFRQTQEYLGQTEAYRDRLIAHRENHYWDYQSEEYMEIQGEIGRAEEKVESWERKWRDEKNVLTELAKRLADCGKF